MNFKSSITINATVSRVFAVVSDASRHDDILPGVDRVEYLTTTNAGVGVRYRLSRGADRELVSVTEWLQDSRLVTQAESSEWTATLTYGFTADGNQTRLTVECEITPLSLKSMVGDWFGGIFGHPAKLRVDETLEAFRARCESTQPERKLQAHSG